MRKLSDFKNNKSGIFWVVSIAIITLIVADASWVVLMIATSQFVDLFGAMSANMTVLQLGENSKLFGTLTIVVINIGVIVWMITSAFRKETQESDDLNQWLG